jgi:hypothetical protein
MADIPRSSFIPKQTSGAVPSRIKKKKHFHALSYSATVILVASLALGGGTFFYKDYLASQLESEKQALNEERNRFNQSDIASVQELDYKLSVARLLLDTHISPSKVFDVLELTTREQVQFTDFAFSQQPSQNVSLSISGGTEEFKTVALQVLTYGRDALMSNADVTEIGNTIPSVESIGNSGVANTEYSINFTVEGSLAAGALMYDGSGAPLPEDPAEAPPQTDEAEAGEETGTTSQESDVNTE